MTYQDQYAELKKERQQLINSNAKVRARIVKMTRPIDKLKTEMFQNQQEINRLNNLIGSN
jgi:uncharacterized coiled-coil DUF342 family protein